MFFWIHMIFSMICRSLIRTFFANHIRTHITDSYVGSTFYTNSYCLLTTYKLIYYGREILRIRILPCTTRIWPCNTTNSYVFNYTNSILQTRMWLTKKISDRKTYKFVWNSACIQKEKTRSIKNGAPPWAQVCGNLYIYYKNISDTNQKKWIVRFFI